MIATMRMKMFLCAGAVALATWAFPPSMLAQATTSELTGIVRDTTGAVLPGALVAARHIDTGHCLLTRTIA